MSDFNLRIKIRPRENWWGGAVDDGVHMPFGNQNFTRSLDPNPTDNQAAPFLVSNEGRFIWSNQPFEFSFRDGELIVDSERAPIRFYEDHGNLRQAYCAAQKEYFPSTGEIPDPSLFTAPCYSTAVELLDNQCQRTVLAYAESIVENKMPPGVLIIHEGWQEDFGVWHFHPGRFPDPKGMVDRLHELGFKVMLWTCPFVSPDSPPGRELASKGLLLRERGGEIAIRLWWNGYSALLDLTNDETAAWYLEQNERLMDEYGIDGFMFDYGDPGYYKDSDQSTVFSHASDHCRWYNKIGLHFPLSMYRAAWRCAGKPLAQCLGDKLHSWGTNGLASLIPNGLAQGLLGYGFSCSQAIGGADLQELPQEKIDQELMVRYAQCAALFPIMQFSKAPWSILDDEHLAYCREAALLHQKLGEEILELAKDVAETGEPIIRHMVYSYPDGGYEEVHDQFMLGDDILVAPVVKKGAVSRTIHFPEGTWVGDDESVVEGPCSQEVEAPLSRLPWYRRKSV